MADFRQMRGKKLHTSGSCCGSARRWRKTSVHLRVECVVIQVDPMPDFSRLHFPPWLNEWAVPRSGVGPRKFERFAELLPLFFGEVFAHLLNQSVSVHAGNDPYSILNRF